MTVRSIAAQKKTPVRIAIALLAGLGIQHASWRLEGYALDRARAVLWRQAPRPAREST